MRSSARASSLLAAAGPSAIRPLSLALLGTILVHGPTATGTHSNQPPSKRSPAVCWEMELGGDVRSTPAVTATTIYVGNGDGHLYALDRRTGARQWRFAAGSPVDGSPAVSGAMVYVTARNGTVFAVRASDGALGWRHRSGVAIALEPPQGNLNYMIASPVVADTTVYVGGPDGVVYALDRRTGAERWKTALGASTWTAPAVAEHVIYVAANDGRLYALDRRTGTRRWQFVTDGATMDLKKEGYDRRSIQSTPSIAANVIIFGSRDGTVYGVDTATGRERWRASYAPSWTSGSPTIRSDTAFVTTSDAKVVAALDARTGRELWRTSVGARIFPAVNLVGGAALIGTDGGQVVSLDASTGRVQWRFEAGDPIQGTAAVRDGVLYFGSDGGRVFALAPGGSAYPALAVYWDPVFTNDLVPGGAALRDYLAAFGYQPLDSRQLAAFFATRLEDRRPSVVVFAQDVLPPAVASDASDTVLFRRYLESGGKVVWLGNPPLALPRDSVGGVARDSSGYPNEVTIGRSGKVLGARFATMQADEWPATPTARGRAWGLRTGILAGLSLDTAAVSEVLELTQAGRAAAWVHNYGGPPGTGFVFLGAGGIPQELPVPLDQLPAIRRAAEYGVLRRPDAPECR
jgi:outer membrane protein assembly factor BamB